MLENIERRKMNEELCNNCKCKSDTIKRRRTATQYPNEADNYIIVCINCYHEINEYWCDMIRDTHEHQIKEARK